MSDRLRVVMVTTSYPRRAGDSAGHFVAALASSVSALGHEVSVIAPHEAGIPAVEEMSGVPVCRMRYGFERFEKLAYGDGIVPNIRKNPFAAFQAPWLAAALRRGVAQYARDADVIHAHWAPTAALSRAGDNGVPLVVSLHGSDLTLAERGGAWREMLVRGLAKASAVNVMARSQDETLVERGLYEGPIEIIPCGVVPDLSRRPRPRRGDGDTLELLFVGRLVPEKGTADLVKALPVVAESLPQVRLTIAGAGRSRRELEALVASLGISNRVRFLGAVPHEVALDLMSEADLLVLPSYAEGSPLSVTEALALGTPVIGTDVGAMPELVGNEGVLVRPGDVGSLADAIVELGNDNRRREAIGSAARVRIGRDYAWPSIAQRMVELYRTAIAHADGDE